MQAKITGHLESDINGKTLVIITMFAVALFCSVHQNITLAGIKLVDNLSLEIQSKTAYTLKIDKDRSLLHVSGIMEIGILSAFENMLSKHPELKRIAFSSTGGNI